MTFTTLQSGRNEVTGVPHFQESLLHLADEWFGHLPVDIEAISVFVEEHQVIRELQYLQILLGEERAPGADVRGGVRELGEVVAAQRPGEAHLLRGEADPRAPRHVGLHRGVLGARHELVHLGEGAVAGVLVHAAEVGGAEVVEPEHDVRDHDVREGDALPRVRALQEGLSAGVGPLLVGGAGLGEGGVPEQRGQPPPPPGAQLPVLLLAGLVEDLVVRGGEVEAEGREVEDVLLAHVRLAQHARRHDSLLQ